MEGWPPVRFGCPYTSRNLITIAHVSKSRSDRWAIAAACLTALGAFAAFAGTVELASSRDLPPGWTRYQPPWTIPVFVAGIAMLFAALIVGIVAVAVRKR